MSNNLDNFNDLSTLVYNNVSNWVSLSCDNLTTKQLVTDKLVRNQKISSNLQHQITGIGDKNWTKKSYDCNFEYSITPNISYYSLETIMNDFKNNFINQLSTFRNETVGTDLIIRFMELVSRFQKQRFYHNCLYNNTKDLIIYSSLGSSVSEVATKPTDYVPNMVYGSSINNELRMIIASQMDNKENNDLAIHVKYYKKTNPYFLNKQYWHIRNLV